MIQDTVSLGPNIPKAFKPTRDDVEFRNAHTKSDANFRVDPYDGHHVVGTEPDHHIIWHDGNYPAAFVVPPKERDLKRTSSAVVVKLAKAGKPSTVQALKSELSILQILQGAKHAVKLVELPPAENPRPSFIAMEHMNLGDLYHLSNRLRKAGLVWPQRACWLLFDSLCKGLVAMKYPPALMAVSGYLDFFHFYDRQDPGEEDLLSLTANMIPAIQSSELVHFDLDAQNVLVHWDPSKHRFSPIFKIHDFGLSREMGRVWSDPDIREWWYWERRRCGKYVFRYPEQWHEDWDRLQYGSRDGGDNFSHGDLQKHPRIAGRYSSESNVYSIGMIMKSVISGILFELPLPRHSLGTSGRPSYGTRMKAAECGAELKYLVIGCMSAEPRDRPSLLEIQKTISKVLANPTKFKLESDADMDKWAKAAFMTASEPAPASSLPGAVNVKQFRGRNWAGWADLLRLQRAQIKETPPVNWDLRKLQKKRELREERMRACQKEAKEQAFRAKSKAAESLLPGQAEETQQYEQQQEQEELEQQQEQQQSRQDGDGDVVMESAPAVKNLADRILELEMMLPLWMQNPAEIPQWMQQQQQRQQLQLEQQQQQPWEQQQQQWEQPGPAGGARGATIRFEDTEDLQGRHPDWWKDVM